jgi:hypothetical protein
MIGNVRHNELISQHVEVALVYKDMLGLDEARRYLERECVPHDVVERVLLTEHRRLPPRLPASTPPATCRRKNLVHDAIVEAALQIEKRFGAHNAAMLLRAENVAPEVVERVIAPGPRQVRARARADALESGKALSMPAREGLRSLIDKLGCA